MGDSYYSFMCSIDLATDVFPCCIYADIGVDSQAQVFERSSLPKGKDFGGCERAQGKRAVM